MFMVKSEMTNIKNLLRVKVKLQTRGLMWFGIAAAIMLLSNIVGTIVGITQNSVIGAKHYDMTDYSSTFFIGIVIYFIVAMLIYRRTNDYLSVFPQTNNSRFIASQLMNYYLAAVVAITALVMYLLSLFVIKILSLFVDNIYFALEYNLAFVIVGFFAYLAYSILIISAVNLIGVILRKWTFYAATALTALLSLTIINMTTVGKYISSVLEFFTKEASIGIFFVKVLLIWLIITILSLVINRFTVYYKGQNSTTNKKIVIICFSIAAAIMIIVPILLLNSVSTTSSGGSMANYTDTLTETTQVTNYYLDNYSEIRIDVSHLPDGSKINIATSGDIHVNYEGAIWSTTNASRAAYVYGADYLSSIQGDTIIIRYRAPFYHVNGIEVMEYVNARMTAYLENNTLYIDYSYDDVHVFIMPVWSIVRQFDYFRDKNVHTEKTLFYTSGGGNSTANISIRVE